MQLFNVNVTVVISKRRFILHRLLPILSAAGMMVASSHLSLSKLSKTFALLQIESPIFICFR